MRRLDTAEAEEWVNVGLYGPPGTGKTSFGVTATGLGPVLYLLSEHQGMVHIREAADRLGVPLPRVLEMDSVQDYRDVLKALRGDRTQPFIVRSGDEVIAEWETFPVTVVLDSTTDLCGRIIVADIRQRAPQSRGRDGLPKDADRFFNTLGDMAQNLILAFRDAPCHTIFLCLQDDKMVGWGDNAVRRVAPKFPMRNLADTLGAAVNTMGMTYRVAKDGKSHYAIALTGPESHVCLKQCRPLRDIEEPDFTSWVQRLTGLEVRLEETPGVPDDFAGLNTEPGMTGDDTSAEGRTEPEPRPDESDGSHYCTACGNAPVDSEGEVCEACLPPPKEEPVADPKEILDNMTVPDAVQLIRVSTNEELLLAWKERDSRGGVTKAVDQRLTALAKGRATVARSAGA